MKHIVFLFLLTTSSALVSSVAYAEDCISPTIVLDPDSHCSPPLFGGTPRSVAQPDYAFQESYWYEYARYIQSTTNVWLTDDGAWIIETTFSNGNRLKKQTMGVSLVVTNAKGECLFGAVHEVDLDPSFGGSANEYISTSTGSIGVKEVGLVLDTKFTASVLTGRVIDLFNQVKPYGQTLPNGERRACG